MLLALDRTRAALLLRRQLFYGPVQRSNPKLLHGPERQLLLQGSGACSGILKMQAVRHA